MLHGKCTENCLLLSYDAAYFLPLFYNNGGMLCIQLLLSHLKSIPVYGNAVDLNQKCTKKL